MNIVNRGGVVNNCSKFHDKRTVWFVFSQNARITKAFIENAIILQVFDEIAQAFYFKMIYFWF